jgi:hypothetical protein
MEKCDQDITKKVEQKEILKKISLVEAAGDLTSGEVSELKDYFGALEAGRRAGELEVFLPYGYECLGDFYLQKKDYPMAAICYAISLELFPSEDIMSSLSRRGAKGFDEKSLLQFFTSSNFRGY